MYECNAEINSTMLGVEDHGILTFMIMVGGKGWGQGFGGYGLDTYVKQDFKPNFRYGTALGMEMIRRILDTLEIDGWEKLTGKTIRIRKEAEYGSSKIDAIGHPTKDKWFSPAEAYEEWNELREHAVIEDLVRT